MAFTRGQLAPATLLEPPPEATDSDSTTPVFLDGRGRGYDLSYRIFPESKSPVNDPSLIFPSPVGFKSKESYFEAVTAWKKRLESRFSGVELPVPISSMHYRPKEPSVFNPGDPASRRFRPEKAPCLPLNFNKMFDISLHGQDIDPEEDLPFQLPRRNVVKMKDQITSERQWQSELVPAEPTPSFYNSFEDYSNAYKNWSRAAQASLTIRIPRPDEFGPILKIETAPPNHGSECQAKEKTPTQKTIDFTWVETMKTKEMKTEPNLSQLLKKRKVSRHSCSPATSLIFGVDQNLFVEQMLTCGVYEPSLEATQPVYPFGVLEMRSQRGAVDAIIDVVTNDSITEEQLIFQLMKVDFDTRDFKWAMERRKKKKHRTHRVTDQKSGDLPDQLLSMTPAFGNRRKPIVVPVEKKERRVSSGDDHDHVPPLTDFQAVPVILDGTPRKTNTENTGKHRRGTLVLRHLKNRLTPGNIIKALFIGKNSPDLCAKMSIFLRSVVNTKFGISLFHELLLPANIDSLYETVGYLVALANFQLLLISPSKESEFAIKMSQFHLLSSLLMDNDAVTYQPFHKYLREKCRQYSHELSKMVSDSRKLQEELWKSLMTDEANDRSKLMNMVALSSVLNFKRIILGGDFLRNANRVSKFAVGRRFLLRAIYNENAFNTAMVFLKGEIAPDEPLTDYSVMIMRYMLSQLLRHFIEHNLVYDSSVLFYLFKPGEISHRLALLLPTAKLLCTKEVAQRANQSWYQKNLAGVCQIIISSDTDRIRVMKILLPFAEFSPCAAQICSDKEFVEYLSGALSSVTVTEFLLSWKLLGAVSKFENVVGILMNNETFTKTLGRLADERQDVVVKLIEFLIEMWGSPSRVVREAAANGMLRNIGTIACLPGTASQKFKGSPLTMQLVEKFVAQAIAGITSGTTNQANFGRQLEKHLMSVGVSSRSGAVILPRGPMVGDS